MLYVPWLFSCCEQRAVNLPGYYYDLVATGNTTTGDPKAFPCAEDTYGPGFRKQRACPRCPDGLATFGKVQQTSLLKCDKGSPGDALARPEVATMPSGLGYGCINAVLSTNTTTVLISS